MTSRGLIRKYYIRKLSSRLRIRVRPIDHIQQQLFWYGHYERKLCRLMQWFLQPHWNMLDLGANIGYFTLIASQQLTRGKIYSFEPASGSFHELVYNIELNQLPNVMPVKAATGNMNGTTALYLAYEDNQGMHSVFEGEEHSGNKEMVETVILDSWLKLHGNPPVDFIKMDIEGAEQASLEGLQQTIQLHHPHLLIEINPITLAGAGSTPREILDQLIAMEYTPFLLDENGRTHAYKGELFEREDNLLFVHKYRMEDLRSGNR